MMKHLNVLLHVLEVNITKKFDIDLQVLILLDLSDINVYS